jgi:hypothetical protein
VLVTGKLFGHPGRDFFSEFDYVGRVGRYIEIHIFSFLGHSKTLTCFVALARFASTY